MELAGYATTPAEELVGEAVPEKVENPKQTAKAPSAAPRGQRQPPATAEPAADQESLLSALKRDFRDLRLMKQGVDPAAWTKMADADKQAIADEFKKWAQQQCLRHFDALKSSAWTEAELRRCRERLTEEMTK